MGMTGPRPPRKDATPPAAYAAALSGGPAPRARERRRSVRWEHHTVGAVRSEGTPANAVGLQVMVVNVSLGGVGFRSPAAFDVGTRHSLRIGTGPLYLTSRFEVVSCRRRADGLFDVSGSFC